MHSWVLMLDDWFSTHGGNEVEVSTLVTYPLKSENRRLERREDILSRILSGDAYGKVVHRLCLKVDVPVSKT